VFALSISFQHGAAFAWDSSEARRGEFKMEIRCQGQKCKL